MDQEVKQEFERVVKHAKDICGKINKVVADETFTVKTDSISQDNHSVAVKSSLENELPLYLDFISTYGRIVSVCNRASSMPIDKDSPYVDELNQVQKYLAGLSNDYFGRMTVSTKHFLERQSLLLELGETQGNIDTLFLKEAKPRALKASIQEMIPISSPESALDLLNQNFKALLKAALALTEAIAKTAYVDMNTVSAMKEQRIKDKLPTDQISLALSDKTQGPISRMINSMLSIGYPLSEAQTTYGILSQKKPSP